MGLEVLVEVSTILNIVRGSHMIYNRYFDDLFILASSIDTLRVFVDKFRASTAYFKFKVREISSSSVTHLDLTVTIASSRVVVQPTLQKVPSPLCPTSCHAPHVHRGWPRAVRSRVARLASDAPLAFEALLESYAAGGAHPYTMHLLEQPLTQRRTSSVDLQRVICVLRYHPHFAKAFILAVRQVPLPPSWGLTMLPSWRNGLPSTLSYLTAHNDRLYDDALGSGRDDSLIEEGASLLSSVRPARTCSKHTATSLSKRIESYTFAKLSML